MNIESFRNFCLAKPGVEECLPFGPDTLVFKVMGKMFALASLEKPWLNVNLKCEPEKAIELREHYENITPGYHMSKIHWNTISFELNELPNQLMMDLINHSYDLVVSGLTKKMQQALKEIKH